MTLLYDEKNMKLLEDNIDSIINEARRYALKNVYEPSLKYSSPFLFFKDTGISFSLKMKYQIDEYFSLSTKWYVTLLQNKDVVKPNSSTRSGVNIQCSFKF